MQLTYFKGSPEQLHTVAEYMLYSVNETRNGRTDIEILQEYCGDESVTVGYESKKHLTFISKSKTVGIKINKQDFSLSKVAELSDSGEIIEELNIRK